jgi:hypothetical protein
MLSSLQGKMAFFILLAAPTPAGFITTQFAGSFDRLVSSWQGVFKGFVWQDGFSGFVRTGHKFEKIGDDK